jgi:hypothetical protein
MSSPADDAADVAARLERVHTLTKQLVRSQADSAEARALADRIEREIADAHAALRVITPETSERKQRA